MGCLYVGGCGWGDVSEFFDGFGFQVEAFVAGGAEATGDEDEGVFLEGDGPGAHWAVADDVDLVVAFLGRAGVGVAPGT